VGDTGETRTALPRPGVSSSSKTSVDLGLAAAAATAAVFIIFCPGLGFPSASATCVR
jgi:hypothetical protein